MSITVTQFLHQHLEEIFGPAAKSISEKDVERSLNLSDNLLRWKVRFKDLLNVPETHIQGLYTIAYDFYQKNNLDSANNIFLLLTIYDPWNEKYWEGLGATLKMKHSYTEALVVYTVLSQLNQKKISYYLEMAEILFQTKQFDTARECCEMVEMMYKDPALKTPENEGAEEYMKRAKALLNIIEQKQ